MPQMQHGKRLEGEFSCAGEEEVSDSAMDNYYEADVNSQSQASNFYIN
jgi:hypothetical protein